MTSSPQPPTTTGPVTLASVGARLDRLPTGPFHRRVMLLAGLTFVFEVGDQGAVGMAASALREHLGVGLQGVAFAVSAMYLGLLAGAVAAGQLGDRLGRRTPLIWGMAGMALFSALAALSPNITVLVLLRLLTGVFLGAAYVGVVVYLSEVFPHRRRALALAVAVSVGTLATVGLTHLAGVVVPMGEHGWRIIFALGLLGLLVVPACWRLPESPRWLVAKGRTEEAEQALRGIEESTAARRGPLPEPVVPELVHEAGAGPARARELPFAALFRGRLAATTLMLMICWICYSATMQVTTTWTPTILGARGFDAASALSTAANLTLGSLVGSLVAIVVADRFPRRAMLIGIGLIGALAALAFGLATDHLLLLLAGGAVFFFAGITSPVLNTYMAEEFPTEVRARGSGIAFSAGRLTNVAAPFTIALLLGALGHQAIAWASFGAWLLLGGSVLLLGRRRRGATGMREDV